MASPPDTRNLLLRRAGLVFLEPAGTPAPTEHVRAVELELVELGYVPSARLSAALSRLGLGPLAAWRTWATGVLAAAVGGAHTHVPLFRKFPDGVPEDTEALWWKKVLSHFLQAEGQPCLFCRRSGTTHVLSPCRHVVCDRCFDGANYTACPACERAVDRASPFFQSGVPRGKPVERVIFKLVDLGEDIDAATGELVTALCSRKQALSPVDREDLAAILGEHGERVYVWLPEKIPLKENIALVFGTIFQLRDPMTVLPIAQRYLATATDVLRLIAAYSGVDPSLQRQTRYEAVAPLQLVEPSRWWGKLFAALTGGAPGRLSQRLHVPVHVHRFKVAKLSRPLRRALLALLEGLAPDRLVEDMLRHRSYWVWVGEFLHPHEYAARFPNVARAFQVVRRKGPDGSPAPPFKTWYGRVEAAATSGDAASMVEVLRQRPGELARHIDHALRIAASDPVALGRVTDAFVRAAPQMSTPVLVTLRSFLPTRTRRAPVRLFWPKGEVAKATSLPDVRSLLTGDAIAPVVYAAEAELLARFGVKRGFDDCIVDRALRNIPVPFNERTASRSAVSLPRGAHVAIPTGKILRMFLHWCQPEHGGEETDIDLSVAFYDAAWRHVGVCSYYEMTYKTKTGEVIAQSGGDRRDGPFPDGASELVDVDRAAARAAGVRYAVMVVNAFSGMPFSQLERGFAGLMLRDDTGGQHFDARTVELKFDLQGANGVFTPLVVDLDEDRLHWLDVYGKGQLAFNNVANSNRTITKVCPEMIAYFASGLRPTMYDLALLHAAARGKRVWLRDALGTRRFVRGAGEDAMAFLGRLSATAGEARPLPTELGTATFAALHHGDLDLPPGATTYALFRELVTKPIAAADLLS